MLILGLLLLPMIGMSSGFWGLEMRSIRLADFALATTNCANSVHFVTLSLTAIDFLALTVTIPQNQVTFIMAVPASQCINAKRHCASVPLRRCGKYRNEGAFYCGQFHQVLCGNNTSAPRQGKDSRKFGVPKTWGGDGGSLAQHVLSDQSVNFREMAMVAGSQKWNR